MTRDDAFTDAIRTEPELQAAGDALADLPSPAPISPALKNSVLAAIAETPQDNVTTIASRRRPTPRLLTIAAACLAIASVGIGTTVLWSGSKEESGGSRASISAEQAGTREMHAIMGASDVRSADMDAKGANLSIVVSDSMGKGGAMVDGQPVVDAGMGAQVWAVGQDGTMRSAGVIGPEPHSDVWMPLPANIEKVMVTEEPMAGSHQPTGRILAETPL